MVVLEQVLAAPKYLADQQKRERSEKRLLNYDVSHDHDHPSQTWSQFEWLPVQAETGDSQLQENSMIFKTGMETKVLARITLLLHGILAAILGVSLTCLSRLHLLGGHSRLIFMQDSYDWIIGKTAMIESLATRNLP